MASISSLKHLIVGPIEKHTASVIFLHGLGDSGQGWAPVATMLSKNPELSHIKFILPHAPVQPVTLNFGMRMPSWFDIRSLDEKGTLEADGEDQEGMLASSLGVNKLIADEVDSGIESSRVVVGGFSQGGAIGLLTGLTSERRLGGIVALSTWLPMSRKMSSVRHQIPTFPGMVVVYFYLFIFFFDYQMMSESARNVPIFFGHSIDDPVVKYEWGRKSFEALKGKPFKFPEATEESVKGLTWKEYHNLGHGSGIEEINDLAQWLKRVVPGTEPSTS